MPNEPLSSPTYSALSQASDVHALTRSLLNDVDNISFQNVILLPILASAYRDLQRELYYRVKHAATFAFTNLVIPAGVTLLGDMVNAAAIAASPTGLVRTSGIVTATTSVPHGLLVGMGVQIAGSTAVAGGPSFNSAGTATATGFFTVLSVPSSTTFTYAQTAVNGTGGGGTATINPALPTDYVGIDAMWEKAYGSTDRYVEVTEAHDVLPDYDPTQQLRYYNQSANGILFVGATQDNQLKFKYARLLTDIGTDQDYIRIRGSLDALAYMTAAIAARARGVSKAAQDFAAYANLEIDKIAATYIKPKQRMAVRRHSYGARRRTLYL